MQLVMVHGAGGSSLSFHYQVKAFPNADAPDLPGHPKGTPCRSIEGYAEWVRGYIAGKGYGDVVLVGHSMGGAVAQWYAWRYPSEIKGLVLIGTGARLRVAQASLQACRDAMTNPEPWLNLRREALAKVAVPLREAIVERTRQVGPAVQLNDFQACDAFDMLQDVKSIRVPTLLVQGTRDEMTPPVYAEYLASNIAGARLVTVQDATHSVHMEYPDQVNKAIAEFLKTLG